MALADSRGGVCAFLNLPEVEPKRCHDPEIARLHRLRRDHSCTVLVGRPSSTRPVSSQIAGLTWK